MKKPVGVTIFGVLYLILSIGVIIAYVYLVATNWSIITFEDYDAVDIIYTAAAAEFIAKYALIPAIFIGGVFALPGSILILFKEDDYGKQGYYLMLMASVLWTLPLIGLINIWYFLKSDVKELFLD